MPTRLLREGILSSDRVEQLDPPAEVFYRRLMSKVDDFGLYDARPSILRANLYPLRIDRVREADITRWIAACEKAGLIALYQHDGKPFMQMLDTEWQTRSEPKFPLPPWGKGKPSQASANNCLQQGTPVTVFGDGFGDAVDTPKAPKGADVRFEKFWASYPSKVGKDAARKAFDKRKPDEALLAQMLSAIEVQRASEKWLKDGGQYIPNPSTWLNQGRWMDGASSDGGDSAAWHETRGGIEKKAVALGLPRWDECSQFSDYKARVIAAAGAQA
jgi:hypothetical protein